MLFTTGAIVLGYYSIPKPEQNAVAAVSITPPPIYEIPGYYGFSSDTNRFNRNITPDYTHFGQFGIPESMMPDGMGCLVRTGSIGIDNF